MKVQRSPYDHYTALSFGRLHLLRFWSEAIERKPGVFRHPKRIVLGAYGFGIGWGEFSFK